jgi:hypothetical protein
MHHFVTITHFTIQMGSFTRGDGYGEDNINGLECASNTADVDGSIGVSNLVSSTPNVDILKHGLD